MSEGVKRIAAERERQMKVEGWDPDHDAEHVDGELALVAALYATPIPLLVEGSCRDGGVHFRDPWPDTWDDQWDKRPRNEMNFGLRKPTKKERIRMLEKAGALIAAEIDRLLRRAPSGATGDHGASAPSPGADHEGGREGT